MLDNIEHTGVMVVVGMCENYEFEPANFKRISLCKKLLLGGFTFQVAINQAPTRASQSQENCVTMPAREHMNLNEGRFRSLMDLCVADLLLLRHALSLQE